MKNQVLPSPDNGHSMQLQDILRAIETQDYISKDILREHFWDMFIVDAFIGNFDRHNGNWGFLYNKHTDEMTIAPIYDCAKCLNPNTMIRIISIFLTFFLFIATQLHKTAFQFHHLKFPNRNNHGKTF